MKKSLAQFKKAIPIVLFYVATFIMFSSCSQLSTAHADVPASSLICGQDPDTATATQNPSAAEIKVRHSPF